MPRMPRKATAPTEPLDTGVLTRLVGYNARRASLAIAAKFYECMAPFGLTQAEYSVLALLSTNAGATSRQLCATLEILPPNFVSLIGGLDKRGLVERRPHPRDGRAIGLHLTSAGETLAAQAGQAVTEFEMDASAALTARERATVNRLLRKLYS